MKLVKEHINFERGLDPKDAMSIGDIIERKKRLHQKMYTFIDSTDLYKMNDYSWPEFSFTSKEILGPDSLLCTNEYHYGENAEFTLGYDDGTGYNEGFYLVFDNNGHINDIKTLQDVKTFLGGKIEVD